MIERWVAFALLVGLSIGGYQVFTKMAAGKISDNAGGFWLEMTALVGMGLFMLLTRQSPWGEEAEITRAGLLFSVAGGVCVALATVMNFTVFRLHGPLSAGGPIIILGGLVIVVFAGAIFFGETLTPPRIAGLVLAIAAIWLLAK